MIIKVLKVRAPLSAQNFIFALEASLLGQIFTFRTIFHPRTLSADIPAARIGLFTNFITRGCHLGVRTKRVLHFLNFFFLLA